MATIDLDSNLKARLRHIDTDGMNFGPYPGPDFLILGPQRTGTTWLHWNLIEHSEIYFPIQKELYFFNFLRDPSNDMRIAASNQLYWYCSHFKLDLWKYVLKNLYLMKRSRSLAHLDLHPWRFLSPVVMGEATASYAAMDEDLIDEALTLLPDVRAIMMIRHPVDRAWSHAKKDLLRQTGRRLDEVPFSEFETFYTHPYVYRCGQYRTIIRAWRDRLGPERFLLARFDSVRMEPVALMKRVCRFIGVSPLAKSEKAGDLAKVVNPTAKLIIPDRHREYLTDMFREEIPALEVSAEAS